MKNAAAFACLLVLSAAAPAFAAQSAVPQATLSVGQMPAMPVPPVDSGADALTPLPDSSSSSALPGLTAADKVMPPSPSPIRNDETAATSSYGPPSPPQTPPVSYAPGTAIPFPPSAEQWAARMPLAGGSQAASSAKTTSYAEASAMRPAKAIVHRPPTMQSAAYPRARHIVVDPAPQVARGEQCRGYTRTVGNGQLAAGTACLGGDGVWRVAEEHLVSSMRVARVYHVNAVPRYNYASSGSSAPSLQQVSTLAHLGLTLGSFLRMR